MWGMKVVPWSVIIFFGILRKDCFQRCCKEALLPHSALRNTLELTQSDAQMSFVLMANEVHGKSIKGELDYCKVGGRFTN